MRTSSSTVRGLRWACTLAAVLTFCVWAASKAYCYTLNATPQLRISILHGGLEVDEVEGSPLPIGFFVDRLSPSAKPSLSMPLGMCSVNDLLGIPLLLPFTAFAVTAAIMWWLRLRAWWKMDVRRELIEAGQCPNCRYNRRGLTNNTICPECAAPGPV